jgi:hypothetical protein
VRYKTVEAHSNSHAIWPGRHRFLVPVLPFVGLTVPGNNAAAACNKFQEIRTPGDNIAQA